MKKIVYIFLFMGVLLLGGCNIFSGLDKEDLNAPGAFEFKIDDAMSNGDYTVVVGLIDDKIASSPALKTVDDAIGDKFTSITSITSSTSIAEIETIYQTLTTYLNENISKPEVKEYIELKVTQAEAYLGESGLKMTDIIANLTSAKKTSNISKNVQKSVTGTLNISDLVPSGLVTAKLQSAINSYLESLPSTTGAAFDALKNEYQLAYLNAALSSAISAINRFISVYKDTTSTQSGIVLVSSSAAFSGSYPSNWATEVGRVKAELKAAVYFINRYADGGNSLISAEDRNKLNTDFGKLVSYLDTFTQQGYADFTSAAGLSVGQ